jgi:hypothetical protein
MNDVPSSPRNSRQPPLTGRSTLRIPQAEAETQLTDRIAAVRELLGALARDPSLEELNNEIGQWRDYNRTWLDTNLGGEAAEEYRAASTHWGSPMAPRGPAAKWLDRMVGQLETIRKKLFQSGYFGGHQQRLICGRFA